MKNFSFGLMIQFVFFLVLTTGIARAEIVEILHTNDLHGFQEHTVYDEQIGGYATLKTLLDQKRKQALEKKHQVLQLDAGDFMEGSIFYMADRGRANFQMMEALGYDAIVLGNHDWLMGEGELNKILAEESFSFDLLAANVKKETRSYKALKKIKPYSIIQKGNLKIAVIGLTTDEYYYDWAFGKSKILKPVKEGNRIADQLKKSGEVDIVIALTHMGIDTDSELVKQGGSIDLVVGGHSHSVLKTVRYVKNIQQKEIPIVQAGEHAHYLGRLVIQKNANEPMKVLEYQLHEVKKNKLPENPKIKKFVEYNRKAINFLYGQRYLSEVVARTEVELVNSESQATLLNAIKAMAMQEATEADMAVHSPGFSGVNLPVGEITREKLIQTYPRFFDLDQKKGWSLYVIQPRGMVIEFLLRAFLKNDKGLTFSGLDFELVSTDGKLAKVKNIKINGRPLKPWNRYRVVIPEGVVKGGLGLSRLLHHLMGPMTKHSTAMIEAMEQKVSSLGTITKEYEDEILGMTRLLDRNGSSESATQKSLRPKSKIVFLPKN